MKIKVSRIVIFSVFLTHVWFLSFSQETTKPLTTSHFGGAITVTNNGISFIPTFSLGKPAAIFDLNAGRQKLTFEPQLKFSLEAQPWSIIFWWRYKLLNNEKLKITLGAHPALSFKELKYTTDSIQKKTMGVTRYIAGEFAPNYYPYPDLSVGIYLFYSRCLEPHTIRNTEMYSIRVGFLKIPLSEKMFLRFYPQAYFLKMDSFKGTYISGSVTLAKSAFPFSLSAIVNQPIKSNVPNGQSFVWNISLIYNFNREYLSKN